MKINIAHVIIDGLKMIMDVIQSIIPINPVSISVLRLNILQSLPVTVQPIAMPIAAIVIIMPEVVLLCAKVCVQCISRFICKMPAIIQNDDSPKIPALTPSNCLAKRKACFRNFIGLVVPL